MDCVEGPLYILLVKERGNPTSFVIYSHSFFHSRFEFYIGEEGENSKMNHLERRPMILVALALPWCLHMIMQHVLNMQALAFNGQWDDALIFSNCFESMNMSDHSVWALRKMSNSQINYYWVLSRQKC